MDHSMTCPHSLCFSHQFCREIPCHRAVSSCVRRHVVDLPPPNLGLATPRNPPHGSRWEWSYWLASASQNDANHVEIPQWYRGTCLYIYIYLYWVINIDHEIGWWNHVTMRIRIYPIYPLVGSQRNILKQTVTMMIKKHQNDDSSSNGLKMLCPKCQWLFKIYPQILWVMDKLLKFRKIMSCCNIWHRHDKHMQPIITEIL